MLCSSICCSCVLHMARCFRCGYDVLEIWCWTDLWQCRKFSQSCHRILARTRTSAAWQWQSTFGGRVLHGLCSKELKRLHVSANLIQSLGCGDLTKPHQSAHFAQQKRRGDPIRWLLSKADHLGNFLTTNSVRSAGKLPRVL